jgi:hypothetical protein
MNRRTLAALAIILVLCGATAVAGGRRLGEVTRPESGAIYDPQVLTPASVEPTELHPQIVRPYAD